MTSVNWLLEELKKVHHPTEAMIMYAKKLHKQEIIDAYDKGEFNDGMNESAEQYYTENYPKLDVSKGSNECPFFISLTKTTSATICSVCGKEKYLHKT